MSGSDLRFGKITKWLLWEGKPASRRSCAEAGRDMIATGIQVVAVENGTRVLDEKPECNTEVTKIPT